MASLSSNFSPVTKFSVKPSLENVVIANLVLIESDTGIFTAEVNLFEL